MPVPEQTAPAPMPPAPVAVPEQTVAAPPAPVDPYAVPQPVDQAAAQFAPPVPEQYAPVPPAESVPAFPSPPPAQVEPSVLEPAANAAPMMQPDIPDTPQVSAYPPPAQPPAMPAAPAAPISPEGPAPAAHGQPEPFFPGGYTADFPGPSSSAQATTFPAGALAATAVATPQPAVEPTAVAMPVGEPQSVAAVPVSQTVTPESAAADSSFQVAESGPRALAMLVDVALMGVLWMLVGKFAGYGMLATAADGTAAGYPPVALLTAVLVVVLYQGVMLAYNKGQTLGKSIAKIRLVREDGEPIDLGFAVLRRIVGKSRVIKA
ncbi:MAG: RDD family protein [Actinobacteria bacterium]|nr:RDD family protein [Actinomycetota bacterium]